VSWQVVLSRKAVKDAAKLKTAGLKLKAQTLLDILTEDPFLSPPHFEKLVGNLQGFYSRRINIQHRLIYAVNPSNRIVHVLRMWTHYK